MTAWLLTSTFYGQWLPGDPRGSVTSVRDRRFGDPMTDARVEHAHAGEDYEPAIPGLERAACEQLKGSPVTVDRAHAEQLLAQFKQTAAIRRWVLHAVSIMANHMHLVAEASLEVGKPGMLRDFKSYASRRLNRVFGRPASGSWWTDGGSCRPIRELPPAVFYVCHRQWKPLIIWSHERGRIPPSESHPNNVFAEDP